MAEQIFINSVWIKEIVGW